MISLDWNCVRIELWNNAKLVIMEITLFDTMWITCFKKNKSTQVVLCKNQLHLFTKIQTFWNFVKLFIKMLKLK